MSHPEPQTPEQQDVDGRVTVDLRTLVEQYNQELESIEERAAEFEETEAGRMDLPDTGELVELVEAEQYGDLLTTLRDALQTYESLRERYETISASKAEVEAHIDDWGGSAFTIKTDTTWGDKGLVEDLYRSDAQAKDGPQGGGQLSAYERRRMQVFTTDKPPLAPDDPKDYPSVIGEWLNQQIENVTRFGEVEVKNWQLDQALEANTTE